MLFYCFEHLNLDICILVFGFQLFKDLLHGMCTSQPFQGPFWSSIFEIIIYLTFPETL